MRQHHSFYDVVAISTLVLGIAGDGLLRPFPIGINVGLWLAGMAALSLGLSAWSGRRIASQKFLFLAAALVLAFTLSWRSAGPLRAVSILGTLAFLSLTVVDSAILRIRAAYMIDCVKASLLAVERATTGFGFLIQQDVCLPKIVGESRAERTHASLKGLLLAAPLLLVFGGLFMRADAVFAGYVHRLTGTNWPTFVGHLAGTAVCAWLAGGFLKGLFDGPRRASLPALDTSPVRMGGAEVSVSLGLVVALFALFTLIQIGYLFGGNAHVQEVSGLTYSEYARKGFFELCTVAALVLPMLLVMDWLLRPREDGPVNAHAFRALSLALLVLLAVIMGSALHRMYLYVDAYGLTRDRLYATVFMLWLGTLFVWYAATVLRGHRHRFVMGAIATGFTCIIALHAVNPDALIVRVNLARLARGKEFDGRYARTLSDDAIPALVDVAHAEGDVRNPYLVADRLRLRAMSVGKTDRRMWNWGTWRADKALRRYADQHGTDAAEQLWETPDSQVGVRNYARGRRGR
ncbi:MAG: DUF4173 domain-containing protein [bacterium]|nr:DUF4173 domain-containing protein [bacterium]